MEKLNGLRCIVPPPSQKVNQIKAGLFGTALAARPPARELLILRHQGCPRPGCAHQDISPSSPDNQSFSLSARSYHKAVCLSISFICFHLSSQATKSLSRALAAQPRPLPMRGCGGSASRPRPSGTDPKGASQSYPWNYLGGLELPMLDHVDSCSVVLRWALTPPGSKVW